MLYILNVYSDVCKLLLNIKEKIFLKLTVLHLYQCMQHSTNIDVSGGRCSILWCRMEHLSSLSRFCCQREDHSSRASSFQQSICYNQSNYQWPFQGVCGWITGILNKINRELTFSSALKLSRYVIATEKHPFLHGSTLKQVTVQLKSYHLRLWM